jgi:NADPH:quinone reductase-like Zn-dependent oxidoreductase
MKAVVMHGYGGVDQLRYEDAPDPKPGPDEVVVKLAATSVNPVDWKIRRGDMKSSMPLELPVILGRDAAGEVVETGANASNFSKGENVMALARHTYAEYVSIPAAALARIPDGLDRQEAGVLPLVLTTGAQLIGHIRPERGAVLLVTGAVGSVGRTAVYEAKQRGARVIAGVRTRQKKEAEELRADDIVAIDDDGEIEALPQLDAIADTVNHDVIGKLLPKLKSGGVLGSVLGKPKAAEGKNIRVEAFMAQADAALLQRLAEAVRDGGFTIPVVEKFKLSDAAEAQAMSERGGVDGKIMIVP